MFFLLLLVIYQSILLRRYHLFHKKRAIIFPLLISFFFCTAIFITPAHASKPDPEIEFEWIEYLFKKGEAIRTINEGLRFIYFHPTHKISPFVCYSIYFIYYEPSVHNEEKTEEKAHELVAAD